jgi:Xaa-Pro dipeptidase
MGYVWCDNTSSRNDVLWEEFAMELERIQHALQAEQLDGWLFYDFRKTNPIAYQVLSLPVEEMYTRRWFYFIPAQGEPVAFISAVESHVLRALPGERKAFRTWQEMHQFVQALLHPGMKVAMEYSPLNAIPYISCVDAGTVELVRSFGVEVVSSANLAQRFIAQLSMEQVASHREAGRRLMAIKNQLFEELGGALRVGNELHEYQIQQRFLDLMLKAGLILPEDELPIVAVNAHSGNPHYEPTSAQSSPIQRGDLVLFDFWGALPAPGSIYADYTWVAFAGTHDEIPAQQRKVFEIVRRARDSAIAFMRARLAAGECVEGRVVDDVARGVIEKAGYGEYFVHRTGHSIGTVLHGNGANIDNFETQDARVLLPFTCNSIEPGIYLPEFGIRSEVDTLVFEHDVEVTSGPPQDEIVALLS